MEKIIIKDSNVIIGNNIKKSDILIENGYITGIGSFSGNNYIDAENMYASAGFIDLHVHGGGGYDFTDGTEAAYILAAKTHLKHGTTTMTPTITSASEEETLKSLKTYKEIKSGNNAIADIFSGVHIEGSYFSQSQIGAQDPRHLQHVSKKSYIKYYDACSDIARWSAAPEIEGIEEFALFCRQRNIMLSIAHSSALFDDIVKAREIGFSMFTHLYSAMVGVTRINCFRHGGAVEAAFLFDDMYTETIADGKHLPCELLRLVHKIKGSGKNVLVTDAIRAAGQNVTESVLGSIDGGIRVLIEDGVAKLCDRTAFAGSIATADMLVKTVINCGIELNEAIKMITQTPAEILDRNDIGKIEKGRKADIVLFDNDINIKYVIKNGKVDKVKL